MQNLQKQYWKINSSEAVWGIKLKLCRIVSNISLYNTTVLLPLLKHFGCYGNLKFPLTYNEKTETQIYCHLIADILTITETSPYESNPRFAPNI